MIEYVADFETARPYQNADSERVWLWAIRIASKNKYEKVTHGNDISSFFEYLPTLKNKRISIFFHNLKFDGNFIVSYLLNNRYEWTTKKPNEMENNTFTCNVGVLGQVYSITLKINDKTIYFRDSLKLFNSSEEQLAKDYNLDTVKGKIDYEKPRGTDYKPTEKEIAYIENDVYIIAYILAEFREQGFKKYTCASSALYEFCTMTFPRKDEKINFQTSFKMFKERHYITKEQDEDIRKSYRGGWCYVNPKYKNKDISCGVVYDVNSMYPAIMYYCNMPYGKPLYTKGKPFINEYYNLYITHIKVDFKLKKGKFPMIQNKGRAIPTLNAREYLTDTKGHIIDIWVTSVDLKLMCISYDILYLEYIESYSFKSKEGGYFKDYIDRFIEMKNKGKTENKPSVKMFAKIYLNSLYGKMGAKTHNFTMQPYLNDKEELRYKIYEETESDPIYIPLACFITSYARQKLFECIDNNADRFLYADTDSVHLIGKEPAKGIEIDKLKLGAWDNEFNFTRARYIAPKTYIEENENTQEILIKCAGLSKNYLDNVNYENFKEGAKFKTKKSKSVKGGQRIIETEFEIKKR